MELVKEVKDVTWGKDVLYNFTKGYGKVPMEVYPIVLPLVFNDCFRETLTRASSFQECIDICLQKEPNFKKHLLVQIEDLDIMTSRALGISSVKKELDFEIENGNMVGSCNTSRIENIEEVVLLGKYVKDKTLKDILDAFDEKQQCIVFLDSDTLGKDVDVTKINKYGIATILEHVDDEDISTVIHDATIIITNKKILGEKQLDSARKVKLICVTATGVNNIELDYCKKRGIVVSNVKGYSTDSVAQHTFALLLDLYNKNHYYHNYVATGKYSSSSMFTHFANSFHELAGKSWGIVGMGDIGKRVASIASAFGCCVQYYSTSGKNNGQEYTQVDFTTLLTTSDIISIHAPLNENTENLFDANAFSLMKESAYIINVGRGKIINEKDLVKALQSKQLAGAGLDVFEEEPFFNNSPLLKIQDPTKLIMTPHIAWATIEARNRVIDEVCLNIQGYLENKNRNVC